MYRPYWFDRISAGLDAKGMPVAWNNRFAGSSVIARWLPPAFKDGLDPDTTEGAIDLVYDAAELPCRICARGAAGHPDGVLAQRRAIAQCLRHRKLHRRAGGGGEAGSGRLSPRAARQVAARQGRARSRRGEGRLGRSRCPSGSGRGVSLQFVFGTYHGAGRRGRSREGRRGSRPPRRLRGRLRHRRQSRHGRGADPERRSSSASPPRSMARSR